MKSLAGQAREGRLLVPARRRHDRARHGSAPVPARTDPGEAFSYRGGIEDPTVWNHFETEGRLSARPGEHGHPHVVPVPETELAEERFFYIDDVSLQVIEEPPIEISTPLDEYHSGETIPWTVRAASSSGQVKISLLAGERVVAYSRRSAVPARSAAYLQATGPTPAFTRCK